MQRRAEAGYFKPVMTLKVNRHSKENVNSIITEPVMMHLKSLWYYLFKNKTKQETNRNESAAGSLSPFDTSRELNIILAHYAISSYSEQ